MENYGVEQLHVPKTGLMNYRRSSQVKQAHSTTSRLAKIFGRRKKAQQYSAPDDLVCTKSAEASPERTIVSRSCSIVSQPRYVPTPSLCEGEVTEKPVEDQYTNSESPMYTTVEAESANFLALLRPKIPVLLCDMEVLSSISFTNSCIPEDPDCPVDTTQLGIENARTVYCDMVDAFAEALEKIRASKVEVNVMGEHNSPPVGTITSKTRSETSLDVIAQPRSSSRKNSGFSRSLSNGSNTRLFSDQLSTLDSISIYAKRPLPASPQNGHESSQQHLTSYSSNPSRPPKVTRRELLRAKVFVTSPQAKYALPRRGSCPVISSIPVPCADTMLAELEPQSQSNVNHLLGLLLFLYWISAGRKFFDKDCAELLGRANSRCLSLETVIVGFQAEFPQASLEVYMSNTQLTMKDSPQGLYLRLPYANDTFDVISALGLSMTVSTSEWPATLAELRRILKPGGKLELVAVSSRSLNTGPTMRAQETIYRQRLVEQGFLRDPLEAIPTLIRQANFDRISLAHLAIPVNWGGKISQVWSKFYEPLRAYREKQIACAWTPEQQATVEAEISAYRSSRGVLFAVATK